jgi:hypothetical protein
MSEEKEIGKVMREDRSRGRTRKPLDKTTTDQRARIKASMLKAIREADESEFMAAILELGHVPGSDGYKKLMQNWRRHVPSFRR